MKPMLTRRGFGLALAAAPLMALSKIDSRIRGIQFGLQSYSFNGLPLDGILDVIIKCMSETGLGECEIWSPLIEPAEFSARSRSQTATAEERTQARAEIARWRATVSLDYFRAIRKKFEDAGIEVTAFSTSTGSTDEELNRTLEITKALGAGVATLGVSMPVLKRLAPMATQHGLKIGIQGRPAMSSTNPDQICRPEQFGEAAALSKDFRISMDVGDAVGGGYSGEDVVKFVEQQHAKIYQLFLKDRNKANLSLPWGEGDTPIKEILRLIRDKKYDIRGYIDNDYKSTLTRAEDVKRSFAYAKAALG
jgi:sugar phosphate isomerase/epimerase